MSPTMTFDTPIEEDALLPVGTYEFEVVVWTPHKEMRPLGPDKSMCHSVDYEILCTNGVTAEGAPIPEQGRIKGTIKLVQTLKWIILQYFGAIGDRKHGVGKFAPDWSIKHNAGATGKVKIKHRKGASRDFAEVEKWMDPEDRPADMPPAGDDASV